MLPPDYYFNNVLPLPLSPLPAVSPLSLWNENSELSSPGSILSPTSPVSSSSTLSPSSSSTNTDYVQYQSQCDKPQLAYDIYLRLLEIAAVKQAAANKYYYQNRTYTNQQQSEGGDYFYNPRDIFLAAYTGCNLTYSNNNNYYYYCSSSASKAI